MKVSQHLLAVGVADRDGADTRADHPQGRLVQIGRQHVDGPAACKGPEQAEGDRSGASRRALRADASMNVASPPAHHAQVAPRASSCSPISRLAVRIDGGMIEASASRFSARTSAGLPAAAARQAEATSTPSSGPRRRPEPPAGPALQALRIVDQPACDRRFQPPRMGVSADREGRVGDLEQAEIHRDRKNGSEAARPERFPGPDGGASAQKRK